MNSLKIWCNLWQITRALLFELCVFVTVNCTSDEFVEYTLCYKVRCERATCIETIPPTFDTCQLLQPKIHFGLNSCFPFTSSIAQQLLFISFEFLIFLYLWWHCLSGRRFFNKMERNYVEDQANEIEALESIYCDDIEGNVHIAMHQNADRLK